uniref:NADH-ubiquinone oxidoreductase chain 4 n=1 Tax=Hexamermis agrotis TaxID=387665 RepID=A2TN53_9BILA|nr:NADH dehydrogenase subunit 4 [Hexamermis agrotis]ABM79870.1 NADH dehydrogenase subunit 4 [Hexamermis agrotis]
MLILLYLNWNEIFSILMSLGISLVWMIMNVMKYKFKISHLLLNLMWLIMVLFFMTQSVWKFYLLFEMNMIPMVLILMGWGMNMARMTSSIYMMMYTMFFSLPVLIIILNNWKLIFFSTFDIKNHYMILFYKLILIIMFMAKIPIFGLHYWLPKAHVEASTMGSMILAGGLLKMGSFGFFKVFVWTSILMNSSWVLLGTLISSFYCFVQSDQKKLIALSSVSHMGLATSAFMMMSNVGTTGMILLNFTHSVISSFMFFNAGSLSSHSKSRLLSFIPKMSKHLMMMFALGIVVNLGLPPSFSFMSELFSISGIFFMNFNTMLLIFFIMILTLSFSCMYIMGLYQTNFMSNNNMSLSMVFLQILHFSFMMFWVFYQMI